MIEAYILRDPYDFGRKKPEILFEEKAKEIGRKELRPFTSVLRRAIIEWLEAYKKRGER